MEELEKLQSELQDYRNEFLNKKKELDRLLEEAKDTLQATTINKAEEHFAHESAEQKKIADKWLKITQNLAIITLITSAAFAIASFWSPNGIPIFPIISSRLILIATLITATLWSGKIYKSATHLEVVNRHKSLVFKTFEALRDSVSGNNNDVKNTILSEATKAIFTIPSTGYVDTEVSDKTLDTIKNSVHTVYLAKKSIS